MRYWGTHQSKDGRAHVCTGCYVYSPSNLVNKWPQKLLWQAAVAASTSGASHPRNRALPGHEKPATARAAGNQPNILASNNGTCELLVDKGNLEAIRCCALAIHGPPSLPLTCTCTGTLNPPRQPLPDVYARNIPIRYISTLPLATLNTSLHHLLEAHQPGPLHTTVIHHYSGTVSSGPCAPARSKVRRSG